MLQNHTTATQERNLYATSVDNRGRISPRAGQVVEDSVGHEQGTVFPLGSHDGIPNRAIREMRYGCEGEIFLQVPASPTPCDPEQPKRDSGSFGRGRQRCQQRRKPCGSKNSEQSTRLFWILIRVDPT